LDDFIYCANQIIKNWSNSQESECDFSRDFLINLKDLRLLVEKDFIEDHKKYLRYLFVRLPQPRFDIIVAIFFNLSSKGW
jgi:hypothetical protein